MKLISKIALTASALAAGIVSTAPAEAASFHFSYTTQFGDVLAGMLEGDLQADNDIVFVTDISMPTLNGVAAPEITFIQSLTFVTDLPYAPATVSLSGATMDIIACTDWYCDEGFLVDTFGIIDDFPTTFSSSPVFGGSPSEPFEVYNPQNWALTPNAQIPTPALLPGLIGMGAAAIRKRKAEIVEQTEAA